MKVSSPSWLLSGLRALVGSGCLKRGYGRLLKYLPSVMWGGDSVRVGTGVGEMALPVKDAAGISLLLWGNIPHEIRESALIERLLEVGEIRVAIDVGANLGWYSRLMWQAMEQNGGGRVYALEPNPSAFAYLQENTRNRPGLFAYPLALYDSEQPIAFYCASSSNLSSSVRPVGLALTLEATTLDQFCQTEDLISQVGFIKCDVEGGEVRVLRGAKRILCGAYPPIWMIEADERFLEEAGTSVEQLMVELLSGPSEAQQLFYLDAAGRPQKISHARERRGTSNIFVVPQSRMDQFAAATQPFDRQAGGLS